MMMERLLRFLLYAALLTPLLVFERLFFPFVTSKIFAFEGLAMIAILIWLYLWAKRSEIYSPKVTLLTIALFMYIAVQLIAALWGVNFWRSFWSVYERMDGIFVWISGFLFFVVLGAVCKKKEDWIWIFRISLFAGMFTALKALQFFGIFQGSLFIPTQISAVFNSPIYLGVYALFNIGIALFLLYSLKNPLEKISDIAGFLKRRWGIVYSAGLILNMVTLFATFSRGVMVGFFAGLVMFLLWYGVFGGKGSRFLFKVGLPILLAGILTFPLWKDSGLGMRLASIPRGDESRILQWRTAWSAFQERPILGWGPYNYFTAQNEFFIPSLLEQGFDKVHNKYLEVLVDTGILGFISYVGIFGLLFFQLFRARKKEPFKTALFAGLLAGYLAQGITSFDNPGSYLPLFLLLAFINREFFQPLRYSLKPKPALIVSCWLLVVGLLWQGVWQPWRANTVLARTLNLQQKKERDYETILQGYKKTLSYASLGDYEVHLQLGVFLVDAAGISKEFVDFGIRELEKEVKIFVDNVTVHIVLAKLYEKKGFDEKKPEFLKKSEEELLFAINLSPRKTETYQHYAAFLINQARTKDARVQLDKIKEFGEDIFNTKTVQWYLALTYYMENDLQKSYDYLQKIRTRLGSAQELSIMANIAFKLEKYEEAREWYETLYRYNREVPQYAVYLAAAYKKTGDKAHAEEYAKRALELDPRLASEVDEFLRSLK